MAGHPHHASDAPRTSSNVTNALAAWGSEADIRCTSMEGASIYHVGRLFFPIVIGPISAPRIMFSCKALD